MQLSHAPEAWRLLQGVFCVYKPSMVTLKRVRTNILLKLCDDLNNMESRPPENYVRIEGCPVTSTELEVVNTSNLADNPLVLGPRYQPDDFKLAFGSGMGFYESGVLVVGVNKLKNVFKLREGTHIRSYELDGKFGLATEDFFETGKIVQKTTYEHIERWKIDKLLAGTQSSHQRRMFQSMGVRMDSEEAYEMASQGQIRPALNRLPIIYSVKCVEYKQPHFKLVLQCVNESQEFLFNFVHELGLKLKSTAVTTKIRRTRFGFFETQHALLRKHWDLQSILNNIALCRGAIEKNASPDSPLLRPMKSSPIPSSLDALVYGERKD